MFRGGKNKDKTFSKKKRFDYARKKYENPFFKKQKKVTIGAGLKLKIIIILLLLVFASILWFVLYSPYWHIDSIQVSGLTRMDKSSIEQFTLAKLRERKNILIPSANSLFFSEDKLKEALDKEYHFKSLSVKKDIPDTLIINIEEKEFFCVLIEKNRSYYIDNDGYILQEVSLDNVDRAKYPIIDNQTAKEFKNNSSDDNQIYTSFVSNLFNLLNDSPIGFEIDTFIVDNEQETVKIKSKEGPIIKFSTKNSIEDQVDKLIIIRHEKLKDDFINKKYIDLRFGDKIYYQ